MIGKFKNKEIRTFGNSSSNLQLREENIPTVRYTLITYRYPMYKHTQCIPSGTLRGGQSPVLHTAYQEIQLDYLTTYRISAQKNK